MLIILPHLANSLRFNFTLARVETSELPRVAEFLLCAHSNLCYHTNHTIL